MSDRRFPRSLPGCLLAGGIGLCACASSAASGLGADQVEAVRAAYQSLGSAAVEARPVPALPAGVEFERIDVSEPMRSASFGHTTTLLVPIPSGDAGPAFPQQFWVEYGKSTNQPARLFGPFPIAARP